MGSSGSFFSNISTPHAIDDRPKRKLPPEQRTQRSFDWLHLGSGDLELNSPRTGNPQAIFLPKMECKKYESVDGLRDRRRPPSQLCCKLPSQCS